jgi:uncharacterized membrane-anchored protein YhcB (DUF1043 family)
MSSFAHTLITFLGGLIVGGLLVWLLLPARRNLRRLEQEKLKAEDELKNYRADVDRHFVRTAELVNDMTQAYRAVHEQLAQGAVALCSEDSKRLVMSKTLPSLVALEGGEGNVYDVKQPLDYAPSSQGTLAEDFGLKQRPTTTGATTNAPRDYAEGCEDQGCSTVDDDGKPA